MKTKYIQTLLAQLLSIALAFLSFKLAASKFNDSDFGLYNVIRRFLAIINYPFLVGLGISLPIYLAKESKHKENQVEIIASAFIFCFFSLIIVSVLNFTFPSLIVNSILGKKHESLSWIIVFGFSNLYLYTILYAVYRGRQEFFKANIFQVVGAGLSQLLAFLLSGGTIFSYFLVYFILLTIINLTVLFDLYRTKLITVRVNSQNIKTNIGNILKFGLPRVPGEFALFGLMSFPLFFVAKYDSMEMAGYVAISFTLVQLVASLYEFLGTLLLPKSAQMISEKRIKQLRKLVDKIVISSFVTSIFISFFIYFNLEYILTLLGKNKFLDHLGYSQFIIFSIPFYITYLILRNPLDALNIKPYNSYNLCICFCFQFSLLVLSRYSINKMSYYYGSLIIPFFLLGVLSLITWNRQIKKYV